MYALILITQAAYKTNSLFIYFSMFYIEIPNEYCITLLIIPY